MQVKHDMPTEAHGGFTGLWVSPWLEVVTALALFVAHVSSGGRQASGVSPPVRHIGKASMPSLSTECRKCREFPGFASKLSAK